MGFGLLFIGYTMMLTVGPQINAELGLGIDVLPDIVGYLFFFFGLRKLRPYSKHFSTAWWLNIPLICVGSIILGSELLALFGLWHRSIAVLLYYVDYIRLPLLIFFHIYLCLGIKDLSNEVGLPKIVRRCYSAMIFVTGNYFLQMLTNTLPPILGLMALLLHYFVYFFMLFLLFSCYAQIVYADQTDDEQKSIPNPLLKLLEKQQEKHRNKK